MPSRTQVTNRKRRRKVSSVGKKNRKARTKAGTPRFPIHPTA